MRGFYINCVFLLVSYFADVIEYQNKTDAHLVKHKQHKTQCETLGGKLRALIFYPKKMYAFFKI